MNKKYTIFIIDDKAQNIQYLSNILEEYYEIRASIDGLLALNASKIVKPDLILLDVNMPNIDGYGVCKLFKKEPMLAEVPIIFISAFDDIEHKIKAFDNGGVDYVTKPFEPKEILARVKTQLDIFDNKQTITKLLKQQDMFIKKIMHEINTPLSIISLNSDSIERKFGSMNEIDSIKASSKTLSSIYSDLSYMVKKEKRVYEKVSINLLNFVSNRIVFFDELASVKNIHIELESNNDYDIEFNKYELERIIDNTISNAIKYSNENSTIEIFIGELENDFIISIKDEGIGIEDVDKVFQPYFQHSDLNIGLGLGLSIVQEICAKYDIKITCESQVNKGTTISYNLTKKLKA